LKGCIHEGKVTEFDTDTCIFAIEEGRDPKTKKPNVRKLKMGDKVKKLDWDKFLGCKVCVKEVDGVIQSVE